MSFENVEQIVASGRTKAYVDGVLKGDFPKDLDHDDLRAIRFVVENEKEAGRLVEGTEHAGLDRAIARMLTDYHPQEEDPIGRAQFAMADLAQQRKTQGYLAAADLQEKGQPHDVGIKLHWLIDDIVSDRKLPEDERSGVLESVTFTSEGKYDQLDRFAQGDIRSEMTSGTDLDVKGLTAWMQERDAQWGPVDFVPSSIMSKEDLYEEAIREEFKAGAENSLYSSFHEHVAGDPSYGDLTDAEQENYRSDWFAESRRKLGLDPLPVQEERFFEPVTPAQWDASERAVADVYEKVTRPDPTIFADPGLELAALYMKEKDMPLEGPSVMALELAHARLATSNRSEQLSPNEEARILVYDVATQLEARAMVREIEGQVDGRDDAVENARKDAVAPRAFIDRLGIRKLEQEEPMLGDLQHIAEGRFEKVTAFTQAGLSLGISYAKDERNAGVEADLDRLSGRGAKAGFEAPSPDAPKFERPTAFSYDQVTGSSLRAQASGIEGGKPSGETRPRTKGPQTLGDALSAAIAAKTGAER
jgi:hypothetical protein